MADFAVAQAKWRFREDNWISLMAAGGMREIRLREDLTLVADIENAQLRIDVKQNFKCDLMSLPLGAFRLLIVAAGVWGAVAGYLPLTIGAIAVLGSLALLGRAEGFPAGVVHDALYRGAEAFRADVEFVAEHEDGKVECDPKVLKALFDATNSRAFADRLFRQLLIDYSIPLVPRPIRAVVAWGYWATVRLCGGGNWHA